MSSPPSLFLRDSWTKADPFRRDAEAQVVVGTYEELSITVTPPSRAHTPVARTPSIEGTDPFDDYFAIARPTRSYSPNTPRDNRSEPAILPVYGEGLPPYSPTTQPPSYDDIGEHPTLAMYLFKFGFFFPLFWLAGAFILVCPFHARAKKREPFKNEVRRQEMLVRMRHAEVKWARRCLLALSLFMLAVLTIVLIAIFVMRS